ncbi:hypothetical protein [Pseudokordiimonas caeni]|uniref:hypothetical protein n=1 Tax=Pseudokordiimonas caeni TaxID=2997908 RepID=UPI00281185DE|nr:hypothetical protein [Pseudokordiimonas caeni]
MPNPVSRQQDLPLRRTPLIMRLGAWGLLFGVSLWGLGRVLADDAADNPPDEGAAPLVVPVYPRGAERPQAPASPDGMPTLGIEDTYIVLEDGAVVSMADWVLAAIRRGTPGAGMSDYENRFFLGQVARAMVGEDQKMVSRARTLPATPGDALGPAYKGMSWADLAAAFRHTPYAKPESGGAYTGGIVSTAGNAFITPGSEALASLVANPLEELAGRQIDEWREKGLANRKIEDAKAVNTGD